MWIRNSSRHPDTRVEELVRLATAEINMRKVCVNVRNGSLGGAAYDGIPDVSNAPRAARYLITLRLGRGNEVWPLGPVNYHFKAPDETGPRNRFPFFVCNDWEEWLVKLAAHEGRHIEQFRRGLKRSELDCESYAIATLERFRLRRPEQLVLPGLPPSLAAAA